MAGGEDQPQQVVADLVFAGGIELVHEVGHDQCLLRLQVVADLLELLVQHLVAAQPVERAVLCGGHQPGPGIVGHAIARPVFQRRHQGVLGQLLGQPDVAHHARDAGHDLGGFDAPDGIDGLVRGRMHQPAWPPAAAGSM